MATRAAGCSEQVWIAMDDGTRLAATLHLPATGTPQPCLLEALPYRKDDVTASYTDEYTRLRDEFGYAVCRLDLRGTGSSEGVAAECAVTLTADEDHFTTEVTLTAYEDDVVVVKRCWSHQAARRFG